MTVCASEPTVLAASMSTVDLGNCLGLGGGACYSGSSGISFPRSTGKTTSNNVKAKAPSIPSFFLEVEDAAGFSGDGNFDLGPNVPDLSTTLRIPRTPSPLLQKSSPDLRIHAHSQRLDSPKSPRKSFFSKLKKQLSSKSTSNSRPSRSSLPVPTLSIPNPNHGESDSSSPTGLFRLHLSLPLTSLSISPIPSRSPSPLFPFRTVSDSRKRESAPAIPTPSPVSEKLPFPSDRSPNDIPTTSSTCEGKRRIQSLQDYNYIPSYFDQTLPSDGPVETHLEAQIHESDATRLERNRNGSLLNLADCLEGRSGKAFFLPNKKKSKTCPPKLFPTSDSEGMLSEPSRYSCESARRSVGTPSKVGRSDIGTNSGSVAKELALEVVQSDRVTPSINLAPPNASLSSSNSHLPEPEDESQSYAPFVPLVFQHERLQQKLQKPLPLTSLECIPAGTYKTVACLKSVPLEPFPPLTTTPSTSSILVRQRTKSAPTPPRREKSSRYKNKPSIGTPSHSTAISTDLKSQPESVSQPCVNAHEKERQTGRPATAPALNSTPRFKVREAGLIPFPVAKGTDVEAINEESVDSERQRKSSNLKRPKSKKSVPAPLLPSVSSSPAEPLLSTGNTNEGSNLLKDHDPGSKTGSVGLHYSLSLSKHPYAQVQSHGEPYPEESDVRIEEKEASKISVTFASSTSEGETSRREFQSTKKKRFNVPQSLMPPSPTSPTSNSGSCSEASSQSPTTPRSPTHWTVAGGVGIATAMSGIGLGISGSAPTSGSEDASVINAHLKFGIHSDGTGHKSIGPGNDTKEIVKEYISPHPYSRSYSTTNAHFPSSMDAENDASPPGIQKNSERPSTASSINRRPTDHHGVEPSKPAPIGPLPSLPGVVQGKQKKDGRNTSDDHVPLSPVPSEYIKNVSIIPSFGDDDSISHQQSYASHSSESYEHDPEYEALLAANTRANAGELRSVKNIGVGRQLLSRRSQTIISKHEDKRKRVYSEAARHPGEWTLFLGSDTPPRREDIIEDLNSIPMTGIKTLNGARARTKSESALNIVGSGYKSSGMKRMKSSLAQVPTFVPPPPVPKLDRKHTSGTEDWTLSLPLLPDKKDLKNQSVPESESSAVPSSTVIRSSKVQHLEPGVAVSVEDVFVDHEFDTDLDDATVADFQVASSPFVLSIDSLNLDDDDDFDSDFSPSLTAMRRTFDSLLFSVPRIVSKGSGIESAAWGEDVVKKRRRLSDGIDSLSGMTGMRVRVDVNEDGESVCMMDGQSISTDEVHGTSEDMSRSDEGGSAEPHAYDVIKENLARIDALSEDLKRFNELLREGVCSTSSVDLRHARSYGLRLSQKDDQLKVHPNLDALLDLGVSTSPTNATSSISVKDRVKVWAERSSPVASNVTAASSNATIPMKSRPLPFAPSSPPRFTSPLNRSGALGIGPNSPSQSPGRSATGRAMTMTTQNKPGSHLVVTPTIAAAIPAGVVGSGLKVGGNGRVLSLSCSSAAAPLVTNTQTGSLRILTNETKEKRPLPVVVQSENDDQSDGTADLLLSDVKRYSASSILSTDSFFTSVSSPSQAPTPPSIKHTSKGRHDSLSSESCSSRSGSPTPTVISPPCLTILTSSTTNSTRAQYPIEAHYSPSSSAMPTPLASSFPTVPPLPTKFSSLGEDLKAVSETLSSTMIMQNEEGVRETLPRSESNISARAMEPAQSKQDDASSERDTESLFGGSFYSARSSFEA